MCPAERTAAARGPERRLVGQFTVEKTFAWGGIYGAATSIEDVEVGFADGVAAAVTSDPD